MQSRTAAYGSRLRPGWLAGASFPMAALALAFISILPTASPAQTVTNIYNFTGNNSGAYPYWVKPAQGRDGRLYVTAQGATGSYGSILSVGTDGKTRLLHVFDSTHGATPFGGIVLSSDGNFYGTTALGGATNNGVLFRVSQNGTYTVLHEFAGGADGLTPAAPPLEASDGNLYGTTSGSGTVGPTVYKYSRSTGYSVLRQFDFSQAQYFVSAPIQATDGNLYVTSDSGGASNCGAILKLMLSGTLLWSYSFPCGASGSTPDGQLMQAIDGNFYGTTNGGGTAGNGTVYKVDGEGTVSILYNFLGLPKDGESPDSGLIQATDGNIYGATLSGGGAGQGTLFQLTTGGVEEILFNFRNKKGEAPFGTPIQHTNGSIYGTVLQGGLGGFGAVYSLNMGLGPFISFVRPTAKVGQAAQILGQGLTGTTSVMFGNVAATSFSVVSDTYMTAVLPTGAASGPVTVTTPAGNLVSHVKFRVLQ
jgi:uncharacterized repeat protein (TIGR03803 family)